MPVSTSILATYNSAYSLTLLSIMYTIEYRNVCNQCCASVH